MKCLHGNVGGLLGDSPGLDEGQTLLQPNYLTSSSQPSISLSEAHVLVPAVVVIFWIGLVETVFTLTIVVIRRVSKEGFFPFFEVSDHMPYCRGQDRECTFIKLAAMSSPHQTKVGSLFVQGLFKIA